LFRFSVWHQHLRLQPFSNFSFWRDSEQSITAENIIAADFVENMLEFKVDVLLRLAGFLAQWKECSQRSIN